MFQIKAKEVKGKWERLRMQVKEYPEDVRKPCESSCFFVGFSRKHLKYETLI